MQPLSLFQDTPLIMAHRGGRTLGPENTLHTLRKAKQVGAKCWETDVQLTRDGEVIILHDLNLLRTTNASAHPDFKNNAPQVPWRFTLKELRQLNAAIYPRRSCPPPVTRKWQEVPDILHPDFRIPTLTEALQITAELDMWINVEIKDVSRVLPSVLADSVVQRVLACIKAQGMEDQVIISSFNHDYVRSAKELAPHILTGALTSHRYKGDPVADTLKTKADAWHPGWRSLTQENVIRAREAGLAVNPYTVNSVEDMKRFTEWGVTGMVTDCPQDIV
ncbi:glycerophosphodiester phosphodiesterase family protein [Pseudodesulfovibrio sp. zrk46]|uniref:glycerophosphodiester phosphodiesterase n=1 Tax=Pseudodesulfovibrio sp. zrk46 TaxID=2725288 RepID=UPI0014493F22|nr:glycerophosphodiester phosphodiesterase family protein [Pseudodesulfovibrio sp. zrk46]QJB56750.1 glycerophosphodiester phosphodiesterase [Pseudodesulfovibrio sp. zrk46]